jgi:CheY-like chemotaxis protein
MKTLTGLRVLVIEDDFLVAQIAVDMLEELGAIAIGPGPSVQQALQLIQSETVDAALLDVNLRGQSSDAVAQALHEKGIPYIFVTGYGAVRFDQKNTPLLNKPYTQENLAEVLTKLLN